MTKLLAVVLGGTLGAVIGCAYLSHDIRRALDEVTRAACIQPLGACGRKQVYWNRCSHRVEIVDEDGVVRDELSHAMEIGARPGVEQATPTTVLHDGDAPKMTRAWRCKKRAARIYCHLYRDAASTFGAFVKPNLGDAGWEHDKFHMVPALCPPRQVEV
jgi:hypothetical protein